MKSTNQNIDNQQLNEVRQREIFQIRLRWLVNLIASVALCAAVTIPLAAQGKKTTPRFVDNGDGTMTDNQTGLMWEKKTENNVNDTYSWSNSGTAPDGTLFTSFLARMQCTISTDGTCGLAGHYDWRVPNISELQTILDCSKPNCIDPVFGPTALSFYWSASTFSAAPGIAFGVVFGNGGVDDVGKTPTFYVRAVRGGR